VRTHLASVAPGRILDGTSRQVRVKHDQEVRMNRRLGSGFGLAALTLVLASGVVACGDDGGGTPSGLLEDLNGVWDFTWTNTIATGICSSEVGEVSTGVITITEDTPVAIGSNVTMTGFEGGVGNIVSGSVTTGNVIIAQGSYPEGDGTTTTRYELTSTSATRMEGTEFWSFTNSTGSCPGSQASVVAVLRTP
jgi:hypothetical protein